MHLFYTPDISPKQEEYVLHEDESKHCVRVLRMNKGDSASLIDGRGNLYEVIIEIPHPKKTRVKVVDVLPAFGERNHYLHIAVAPTKNIDRFEWFLEKATEIGIDEITPLICERSERKEVKLERLYKVIIAAIKQSKTAYLPKLNKPMRFNEFIARYDSNTNQNQKFIAHCLNQQKKTLNEQIKPHGRYCMLIGPEGDFTSEEVKQAVDKDFVAISLGNTRLRTETAALYACFETNYLNREQRPNN
ncbi:16S rRNA (uracil(1498)-N(3))-methyltransferase [Olivibacter sp. SDN3]|uniref:16S rRNA (uracil(1498)-N(3))-methyltransferase n=1 Tax=Olivibacter sp. SDN3 TaxID=2764720 RepID=UPI0016510E19|nr:16S rRNA (uracil(1498)-N(3))-methyltransferase [Olivibacter sp. SDN3]QNL51396.1 16S rRNA (uracil(1498)-N(3))-methyltransferase [Olivibacter sp. SDN3]